MIPIDLNEIISEELLSQKNIYLLKRSCINEYVNIIYISNSIELLGYNKKDFLENKIKFENIISKKDLEKVNSDMNNFINSNLNSLKQIYSIYNTNNELIIIEDTTILKRNEQQEVIEIINLMKNITETEVIKKEIQHKREFFKHIVNELNLGIKVYNMNQRILFKNQIFNDFNIGDINELKIENTIKNFINNYNMHNLPSNHTIEKFQIYKSKFTFEVIISFYVIQNDIFIIESIKDISDLVEIQNKLLNLEKIDHMSQLPNKRMLNEDINTLIKEGEKFLLVSFDFEKFKDINLLYGIEKGDIFIKTLKKEFELKLEKKAFLYIEILEIILI